MLFQKFHRPCPRFAVGLCNILIRMMRIHKRVPGIFINVKVMRFAVLGQFGVELRHVFERRILVCLAEMALDWATDLRGPLEGRGSFAPPAETTTSVPRDRC